MRRREIYMKYNNTGCRTSSVLNLSHLCHLLWNPVTFWTKLCRMMFLEGSTKIPHFIFMRQIKHENKRNYLLLISKICKTILSFGTIKSIESKVCRNLVVDPSPLFLINVVIMRHLDRTYINVWLYENA